MAKIYSIQNAFLGGEVSPKIYGRTDLAGYNNALKTMRNCFPLKQGGALCKPGTVYVTAAPVADTRCRGFGFVFDSSTTFSLVFGNLTLDIYRGSGSGIGTLVHSMASPYALADLADLNKAQEANTMFLFHPTIHPKRLQRFSDALWAFSDLPFTVYPSYEDGFRPATTLALSATSGAITFTSGAAAFLASDVGRQIQAGTGLATITGFTSTTIVTGASVRAFDTNAYASQDWLLTDSPFTTVTPSAAGKEGETITLTLAANGWRSTDVGRYVYLNDGAVEITVFTSALAVTGIVRKIMAASTADQPGAWSLESKSFSATYGFPRAGTLFEQRLVLGGTTSQPTTIWGSRTADTLNFSRGLLDDDGFAFTLASGRLDAIRHLDSLRSLLGLTVSSEHSLTGANAGPLTPTAAQIRAHTFHGASIVRPERIAFELLFAQFSGLKLRSLKYEYQTDSYQSQDVSATADHLLTDGIKRMAYAQEPYTLLWVVTAAGGLRALAYDPDTELSAWAPQDDVGTYNDVWTVPGPTGDVVWFLTKRPIGAGFSYFLEYQDFTRQTLASVIYSGISTNSITGLGHLVGATVDILADGVAQPQQTCTNPLTLVRNCLTAEVGLPYIATLTPLPVEFQQDGTAQGRAGSVNEVVLRVVDSLGLKVDGVPIKEREFGTGILDTPPPRTTGDLRLSKLGWERSQPDLVITRELPYSFQLTALIRQITVN